MRIDTLDGLVKDYPSINVCLAFSKYGHNLHVKIIEYGETRDDQIDIQNFFIFPIQGHSSNIRLECDIPLKDPDGEELGTICIPNKGKLINVSQLTHPMLICLIMDFSLIADADVDQDVFSLQIDFSLSEEYLISSSCVLINDESAGLYEEKYKNSSAIWGGFTHDDIRETHNKIISEIAVIDGITIPTSEHQTKLSESIFASNGFDRFLKKYHLLELLYDYICVAKLRTVGNSFKEYRDIMGDYSKDDIVNLKRLISSYVNDVEPLCNVIQSSTGYIDTMKNIFQIHSKDSNPLKDNNKWSKFINLVVSQKLSEENIAKDNKFYPNNQFNIAILNICSYWIYRIRCSIAHNKIGEFIFSPNDEEFVVEFGEALIDIISAQVFSNEDLSELLEKSQKIDQLLLEE